MGRSESFHSPILYKEQYDVRPPWYDRHLEGGPEAPEDRPSAPSRVWNRIPANIHDQIVETALEAEATDLNPRELAVRFTDEKRCFVSEAAVPAPPASCQYLPRW